VNAQRHELDQRIGCDSGVAMRIGRLRRQLPHRPPTLVYPAHGAGSLCGKQLSSDTVSTLRINAYRSVLNCAFAVRRVLGIGANNHEYWRQFSRLE
jgi:hypothetical protein